MVLAEGAPARCHVGLVLLEAEAEQGAARGRAAALARARGRRGHAATVPVGEGGVRVGHLENLQLEESGGLRALKTKKKILINQIVGRALCFHGFHNKT